MAFYKNSGSRMDSDYNLNEKADEDPLLDTDVDANSREWNLNEKADDTYLSNVNGNNAVIDSSSKAYPSDAWGSTFLKESPPMFNSQEEDMDGGTGHLAVPADEMLSDEYYLQDGEELSDSLCRAELNIPSTSGSRLSKKYSEYEDDDDYEDEVDGTFLYTKSIESCCMYLILHVPKISNCLCPFNCQ
jgi:chromodomain-helicase-DNA-binding protein 1